MAVLCIANKADEAAPHWYASLRNPEWWLVVSAFATFIVIAWQAIETRRATQAMRDNTKVIFEIQRPQIAAKAHGNPTQTLADGGAPRVEISLFNRGLTPAYEASYESWIELLTLPFTDFTASADHFKSAEQYVIYPNHDPVIVNIPIRNGITEQQLNDVRRLRLFVCVRVRAEYRDSSKRKRHADFGFYITAKGLGFLPKYNEAT
jgi:hypothetical protein